MSGEPNELKGMLLAAIVAGTSESLRAGLADSQREELDKALRRLSSTNAAIRRQDVADMVRERLSPVASIEGSEATKALCQRAGIVSGSSERWPRPGFELAKSLEQTLKNAARLENE